MTTFLHPSIAALTIVLLTAAPGATQQPTPNFADRQPYPIQCSLPLQMSVRAFLVQLRLELKPSEEQRPAFEELDAAINKAVDSVAALCRSADVTGPTDRLQTALARITESLRAIEALQPAAQAFYAALSDEQKSRLGSFDRWFNRASSLLSEWALNAKVPTRSDNPLGGDQPKEKPLRLCIDGRCDDRVDPNAGGLHEDRRGDRENLGRLWRE